MFDFCGNLEFFSQDLPGLEGSIQKSLTHRIVESRIELVTTLDLDGGAPDLRGSTADALHQFVAGMTLENVLTADQIRFVNLIIDELTANGQMEPSRLFESPYTDHAPTGPDLLFSTDDVEVIAGILDRVRENAGPAA